mgnify:CR=1 FL=1
MKELQNYIDLIENELFSFLSSEEEAALLKTCKGIYYPDRTYRRVVKESPLDDEKKKALLSWLKTNAVDQKHEDAKACLALVRDTYV